MKSLLRHCPRSMALALGLLDDRLQLAGELLRIDDGVTESVGLNVERLSQPGRGKHGEVTGVIVPRPGIQIPAHRLGLPRYGADAPSSRPLEEHVLQDMRDAGPPVGLIEEARLYVSDQSDYRGRVIGLDQQGQSVGEDLPDDSLGPHRCAVSRER